MNNKVKAIFITFGLILLGSLLTVEESFAGNRLSKCGGEGQRPCRIWEKIPSCDSGLKEDFLKDECVGTTSGGGGGGGGDTFPISCGALNQRPCLIIEHIPSCQSGLVENFIDNKCLASGDGSQLGQIVADFEPPDCDTIFGTNTEPTINSLYNFKLATGIPAMLAEKIVPTDTISTPIRVVAALAFLTHFYCELTLEREVAQAGADFEAAMFSEVLETLMISEENFNTKSSEIQSTQATNASNNASGQSAIMSTQATHDADIKAELITLKDSLETKLEEIRTLLQTPQGSRDGFGK